MNIKAAFRAAFFIWPDSLSPILVKNSRHGIPQRENKLYEEGNHVDENNNVVKAVCSISLSFTICRDVVSYYYMPYFVTL
jgi:hypothetical protein